MYVDMEGSPRYYKWKKKAAEQCIKYETVVEIGKKNKEIHILYTSIYIKQFFCKQL